ncbi:MAG: NAD(P)/FAD-dependent oxidoreductase [Xanthomonadaceae bacterium]|nr:NAD(P)/FAD-dependent oxidoreductase [Xanthomonadaceae bacterium]
MGHDFRSDVLILGAGGAGMMCAIHAGARGKSVILIDHKDQVGGKILISGGGRCNFTNIGASPANYVSKNEHFCKSALSRYTPDDFIAMVTKHRIKFHEKKLGQLFCDVSAREIIAMLKNETEKAGAEFHLENKILKVEHLKDDSVNRYRVETSQGIYLTHSLVIATGGLSLPKLGATGLGYDIARQFGHKIVETKPALDGFTFGAESSFFTKLAGVSVDCILTAGDLSFRENILFTHSGLSGPAALQGSLHWTHGEEIEINLSPELDPLEWCLSEKKAGNKSLIKNVLGQIIPSRLAEQLCERDGLSGKTLPEISEKVLEKFCDSLTHWQLKPKTTMGYVKAEVTKGGVDTRDVSSKTMESTKSPGLYFIGEVLDVTGWLGGYNFQWAWASGWAAGVSV